jgi:hypothetical protein
VMPLDLPGRRKAMGFRRERALHLCQPGGGQPTVAVLLLPLALRLFFVHCGPRLIRLHPSGPANIS